MDNRDLSGEWESGWDGHRKAQILRWASLTFREKLMWLDEAQDQWDRLREMNRGERGVDINEDDF
jgi:hypothetical protein